MYNCTNGTCFVGGNQNGSSTLHGDEVVSHTVHQLSVASWRWDFVKDPFTLILWVLLASLGKLGFHLSKRLSSLFPESCMIILLGIVIGIGFKVGSVDEGLPLFDSKTFFLFLLPPIILEAGYFLPSRAFFDNIGTILLYAVVGTLFNAILVGVSLYGACIGSHINITFLNAILFGTLIAAVDPVAVLAVFEEVHVNEILYILVFGESILNDAVTVVLYNMFESFLYLETITYKEVLIALASFFVVSLGGTLVGILWGMATALVTKFTDHVRVIEPIFVFLMSYLAYLCAELFHLSGIMSIMSCAITMKPYVEANISRKSHTTIKYFMKMLSSCSETVIFLLLGMDLVVNKHDWNTYFVLLTIFFISVFRAIGVVSLSYFANKIGRLDKLSKVDQFIMCYGGLRGAVSFSLAILLDDKVVDQSRMFITTTMSVVIFTIFFQGITIKPLVKALSVKLSEKHKNTMIEQMNERLLDHMVAGMEEVCGHHGKGFWRNMFEFVESRYFARFLIRDFKELQARDTDILECYQKQIYREALGRVGTEASNIGQRDDSQEFNKVTARKFGSDLAFTRIVDDTCLDMGASEDLPDRLFQAIPSHHSLNMLLPRSRRHHFHRKYSRNNLDDDDLTYTDHRAFRKSNSLYRLRSGHEHHGHGHRSNNHHRRHYHDHREKQRFTLGKRISEHWEEENDENDQGITFTVKTPNENTPVKEPIKENDVQDSSKNSHGRKHKHSHHPRQVKSEEQVPLQKPWVNPWDTPDDEVDRPVKDDAKDIAQLAKAESLNLEDLYSPWSESERSPTPDLEDPYNPWENTETKPSSQGMEKKEQKRDSKKKKKKVNIIDPPSTASVPHANALDFIHDPNNVMPLSQIGDTSVTVDIGDDVSPVAEVRPDSKTQMESKTAETML